MAPCSSSCVARSSVIAGFPFVVDLWVMAASLLVGHALPEPILRPAPGLPAGPEARRIGLRAHGADIRPARRRSDLLLRVLPAQERHGAGDPRADAARPR